MRLFGDGGAASLIGGSGPDRLEAGTGNTTLTGAFASFNLFMFSASEGGRKVTISGFGSAAV